MRITLGMPLHISAERMSKMLHGEAIEIVPPKKGYRINITSFDPLTWHYVKEESVKDLTREDWDRLGRSKDMIIGVIDGTIMFRFAILPTTRWEAWERTKSAFVDTARALGKPFVLAHVYEGGVVYE